MEKLVCALGVLLGVAACSNGSVGGGAAGAGATGGSSSSSGGASSSNDAGINLGGTDAGGGAGSELCNGLDDNGNGQVDEGCKCKPGTQQKCFVGPPSQAGIGACKWGSQTCVVKGSGEFRTGGWGPCVGSGKATAEVCGDNVDNDCNGVVDNGCSPTPTCNSWTDCSKPECCETLTCLKSGVLGLSCQLGGCAPGKLMDPISHQCRDCTAADCQEVPDLCCGAPACQGAKWCTAYLCGPIDPLCNNSTSSCNHGDLDGDDSFGDCDEAKADPCCPCKVAVGCCFGGNTCAYGQFVKNNQCADCTAADCSAPSCMGLNGCPTNCPAGQYFNGAWCAPCPTPAPGFCTPMLIPACK